jgi:hypothetical protein
MADRLAALEARLQTVARRHWSYRVERLGDGVPLWHVRIPARGRETSRVCVAAGIHGDEPAGVEAVMRLLETGTVPPGVALDVYPCMNPEGYARGSREDGAGRDLNRAFRFGATLPALAAAFVRAVDGQRYKLYVDLHEDDRLRGGYVIEPDGDGLGRAVARTWASQGLPLAPASEIRTAMLDDGEIEDAGGARLGDGWCDVPLAATPRDGGPQAVWMRMRCADAALTLETPARAELELRVRAHLAGLWSALTAVAGQYRFAELAPHAAPRGVARRPWR